MKKSTSDKIRSAVIITTLTAVSIHLINKAVFSIATMKDHLNAGSGNYYNWRFGNIFYKKQGTGKPILLIHDLHTTSSAYEWNRIVKTLAVNHTVYTIDLIGCGRSDKPNFTYTNYLYVQLISDFIKHVIGQKTDVAATGLSGTFAVMACYSNPELFDRMMLINPMDFTETCRIPNKRSKTLKFILESPIIGTLIYNMASSKLKIKERFHKRYFFNKNKCSYKNIAAYHEAAHLGKANAKYLFASIKGRFTNINIAHAIKQINNSIILTFGTEQANVEEIMAEYCDLNPSIEKCVVSDSKFLPQLENPVDLLNQFHIYFQ